MERYTLITGASGGIGRAIALALAKEGRNLILIADKDKEGLYETLALVKKTYKEELGPCLCPYLHCLTYICDVSDEDMVDYLFEQLKKQNLRVENLINNAGISHFDLVQDTDSAAWHRVLAVNLDGPFYMCKKVLPAMIHEKKGSIINISSYWGIEGSAMESAYCASKGGLNAFTLSLAKELKPSNIRVNAIACEFINTKMNAHLNKQEIEDALKSFPSGRVVEPEEVADMAAKLLAPESTVTGQILLMDDNLKL